MSTESPTFPLLLTPMKKLTDYLNYMKFRMDHWWGTPQKASRPGERKVRGRPCRRVTVNLKGRPGAPAHVVPHLCATYLGLVVDWYAHQSSIIWYGLQNC